MNDAGPRPLSIGEAVKATGVPKRTLQRRTAAYLSGSRTPYAIKCERAYGETGDTLVDPVDAQRVYLQQHDQLDRRITAEQYAARPVS